MGQLYLQKFQARGANDREAFDAAWTIANKAMARHGNWGNVERGVKHRHAWGTAWGGYGLIEVEDPKAFDAYQMYHQMNYGHLVEITFEPLADLDTAMASVIEELKSQL